MLGKIWCRLLPNFSANQTAKYPLNPYIARCRTFFCKKKRSPFKKSDRQFSIKTEFNYLTMPKTEADSDPVILPKAGAL